MKFGRIDLNERLGKLTWKAFQVFFKDCNLDQKLKESPEDVFRKLGGKLPVKKKKEGVK